MKDNYWMSIVVLLCLMGTACQKDTTLNPLSEPGENRTDRIYQNIVEEQFFTMNTNSLSALDDEVVSCLTDAIDWADVLTDLQDELYIRNEAIPFVESLTTLAGFPLWTKALLLHDDESLQILSIPFAEASDERINNRMISIRDEEGYHFRFQHRAFLEGGLDKIEDPNAWIDQHLSEFAIMDECTFGIIDNQTSISTTTSATLRQCFWLGNQCGRLEGGHFVPAPVSCCSSSGNAGNSGSGGGSVSQGSIPSWWNLFWSLRNPAPSNSGGGSSTSNPTDPSSGGGGGSGLGIVGNDPEPGGNGEPINGVPIEFLEIQILFANLTVHLDLTWDELSFLVDSVHVAEEIWEIVEENLGDGNTYEVAIVDDVFYLYRLDSGGILHVNIDPIDMNESTNQEIFTQILTVLKAVHELYCISDVYEPIDLGDYFVNLNDQFFTIQWELPDAGVLLNTTLDLVTSNNPTDNIIETQPTAPPSVTNGMYRYGWAVHRNPPVSYPQYIMSITVPENYANDFIEYVNPDCN